MKKYIPFIFLFILVLGYSNSAFSQRKEFTENPATFLKELEDIYKNDSRKESREALDAFSKLWQKAAFDAEEQKQIMEFGNTMLRARLRAYPEFTAYLNLLSGYKNKQLARDKFDSYHEIAEQLLQKSKKDFTDFTVACQNLFEDQVLYKTNAREWIVSATDYTLKLEGAEPFFIFDKTDLTLYTRGDTLEIRGIKGRFSTSSNKFAGQGGEVDWTRVGFSKERAYAKLKRVNINLTSNEYSADSAMFYYPQVFAKPIMGRLMDKGTAEDKKQNASYPRFYSYQSVFELKNIFKNIDYKGGFALVGNQILGTSADSSRAMITIKQGNKVVMRAMSQSFTIEPAKISASKAATSFYLGKDSLYHTQTYFNYQDNTRQLLLSRDNVGLYIAPFFDSYHKLEYNPANLVWNIDSSTLQLKSITNKSQEIEFTSADFFSMNQYLNVQGLVSYNPLKKLATYVGKGGNRTITEKELEVEFQNKIGYINNMLFMLANQGYIFYDITGGKIVVKDKLLHYVAAAENKVDYDIIRFTSVISALPNGKLDLNSFDLTLEGISTVNLSDSQATVIIPSDQRIVVKKDRNMDFGGQIKSGRFDFFGKTFNFNYAAFKIALNNVDSVKFKFPEYDQNGKFVRMRTIQNTIQNANGFLYIDEPNNKSGRKDFPKYPIFECQKESFVFYDKPSIFNGVYDRKRFFFKVNPFIVDNLDKFTAEGLQFPGTFESANIIPIIKNALTIQEDFSLGFKTQSPEPNGFSLYKGKGTGKGQFRLSNAGFRADASVQYLPSLTVGKDIIFFPDSMFSARSESFEIPEIANGKYPPLSGKGTINKWKPYKDSMYVYKGKEAISVYNGKIDFAGSFILTPVELVGNGQMAYQNLIINSQKFAFLPKNIRSKDGEVSIKSPTSKRNALEAKGVNLDLDLTKDFGKFSTNNDTSQVFLPNNRFATTLNTFTYDIASKQVEFTKAPTQKTDDAYFISNNPTQGDLKFKSQKASYNINKSTVRAQGVPFVLIADSKIFTPDEEISIEQEGNIGSLKGAQIITSDEDGYHKIYKAYVTILAENKFTGYGYIDYKDKAGNKYPIPLNDIRVNENERTIARGTILDSSKFYLHPGMRYIGNVNLLSTRKNLEFDGYLTLEHAQPALRTEPVYIKQIIEPDSAIINITSAKNQTGAPLFTGTFISTDSNKIYNLLLGKKKNTADLEVFSATGVVRFDIKNDEFRLGDKAKAGAMDKDEEAREGNMFRYNRKKDELLTEGIFNPGVDYKKVKLAVAGSGKYEFARNRNTFDWVGLIDLPFPADPSKQLLDTLMAESGELEDADVANDNVLNALSMMVTRDKDKEKVINESGQGAIPYSGVLKVNYVFSSLKMTWVDSLRTFVTYDKLGLANIFGTLYNKEIDGVVAFTRGTGKNNDELGILLIPNEGSFNYVHYADGQLRYMGSDMDLVDKMAAAAKKFEKSNKGFRLKQAAMEDVFLLYSKKPQ